MNEIFGVVNEEQEIKCSEVSKKNVQTELSNTLLDDVIISKLIRCISNKFGNVISYKFNLKYHDKSTTYNRMIFYFDGYVKVEGGIIISFKFNPFQLVRVISNDGKKEYDYDSFYIILDSIDPEKKEGLGNFFRKRKLNS